MGTLEEESTRCKCKTIWQRKFKFLSLLPLWTFHPFQHLQNKAQKQTYANTDVQMLYTRHTRTRILVRCWVCLILHTSHTYTHSREVALSYTCTCACIPKPSNICEQTSSLFYFDFHNLSLVVVLTQTRLTSSANNFAVCKN